MPFSTNLHNKLLLQLMTGRAYTLIELADSLSVERSQVSHLLKGLIQKKWIHTRGNRNRTYYYLSPSKLEDLSQTEVLKTRQSEREVPTGMKYCRHCYRHLAGYVGVKLTEALIHKGLLLPESLEGNTYAEYKVTLKGWKWFNSFGIDQKSLCRASGRLTKQCLDFSERKNHLGGRLGDALLQSLFENKMVHQVADSREIHITDMGKSFLKEEFNLDLN